MSSFFIVYILFFHLLGDYVLQNSEINLKKSENLFHLFLHVFLYSFIIFVGLIFIFNKINLLFILVNFITHLIIDFFTSKILKKIYENYMITNDKENLKLYFPILILGVDQYLHIIILLTTAEKWLV